MKKDPILTAPPESPSGQYREELHRFLQSIDISSNPPANDKNTNRKLTTTSDITPHLPYLPLQVKTPDHHEALFKWYETTSPGNRQRQEFIHGYTEAISRMTKEKITLSIVSWGSLEK